VQRQKQQESVVDTVDTVGKALGELGPARTEPRWTYTPPAMKAPFPIDHRTERREYKVNEDPAVLDDFYARFLGPQWPRMLPEELKWLAVTHKSFDQGRRGFNDRLAYFGRLLVMVVWNLCNASLMFRECNLMAFKLYYLLGWVC